jgi:hypothetical protein
MDDVKIKVEDEDVRPFHGMHELSRSFSLRELLRHLAAQAKKKAAHGHVAYAVQEVPFWAPFDAFFDTSCPGNEGCAVDPRRE